MREIPPPPALAPYVECIWSRGASDSGAPHRVLPDGCLDIIFSPRGAVVVGAMTRPLLVASCEASSLLGVRFLPGMATAFLRVPAATLTDISVPLEAVWSDGRQITDHVGSALDSPRAVARLGDILQERLSRVAPIPDDVRAAVDRIVSSGGRRDVARVASSLGVSRQHLARRFAAYVGVSPKTLSRVMRMRHALRAARATRVNWAAVAADLGYCDQSHLVSDFRSLTGLTPSRWASSRRQDSKTPIARAALSLS